MSLCETPPGYEMFTTFEFDFVILLLSFVPNGYGLLFFPIERQWRLTLNFTNLL